MPDQRAFTVAIEVDRGGVDEHQVELGRGGPLALLLGVYGMSTCPDIRSEPGAQQFRTFYDLETIMLRAAEPSADERAR